MIKSRRALDILIITLSRAEVVRQFTDGAEATHLVTNGCHISHSSEGSGSEGTAGADSFTRSKSWALTCGGADSAAGGCDVDTVRCSPTLSAVALGAGKPPKLRWRPLALLERYRLHHRMVSQTRMSQPTPNGRVGVPEPTLRAAL